MLALCKVDYDDGTDNEEFDVEFDNDIRLIDDIQNQNQSVKLPEDLDIDEILENSNCPHQYNTDTILENLDRSKVKRFVQNEYSKLKSFLEPRDGAVPCRPASCQLANKVHFITKYICTKPVWNFG